MNQFKKYWIDINKNMDLTKADDTFFEYVGLTKIYNLDQVIPPQDLIQLKNAIFAINPGMQGLTCFRIKTSSGSLEWIAANVWKKGEYGELMSMELSNIQSLKSDVNSMKYDEMTGVLNKHAIKDMAKQLTEDKNASPFYFCLLDIDHFKNVNDTFGHACGDDVIIDVAHIIKDCISGYGEVGRIGGDEFMLVLDKVHTKPHLREFLAEIRGTVEKKYTKYKGSIDITVSIGSVLYPDYAVNYDNLFELTDKMLYLAKSKGRNRYIIYTPEIHGDMNGLVKVENVSSLDSGDKEDKLRIMLGLFDKFLIDGSLDIRSTMVQILKAYDLDEIVIFEDGLDKSTYAIKRIDKGADYYEVEDNVVSMPFLMTDVFQKHFSVNNVATINIFDLNKSDHADVIDYMEHNNNHHMLVYKMKKNGKTGYVAFISSRENSKRQSLTETNDLIYFSRMIEIK